MTKRSKKIVLIVAIFAAVLIFWYSRATCYEGAPMVVRTNTPYAPKCGCLGKSIILSDGWAYDGDRKFLCLGIPQ